MNGWQGRIVKWTQDGVEHRGQVVECLENQVRIARWREDDEVLVDYNQIEAVKFTAASTDPIGI